MRNLSSVKALCPVCIICFSYSAKFLVVKQHLEGQIMRSLMDNSCFLFTTEFAFITSIWCDWKLSWSNLQSKRSSLTLLATQGNTEGGGEGYAILKVIVPLFAYIAKNTFANIFTTFFFIFYNQGIFLSYLMWVHSATTFNFSLTRKLLNCQVKFSWKTSVQPRLHCFPILSLINTDCTFVSWLQDLSTWTQVKNYIYFKIEM